MEIFHMLYGLCEKQYRPSNNAVYEHTQKIFRLLGKILKYKFIFSLLVLSYHLADRHVLANDEKPMSPCKVSVDQEFGGNFVNCSFLGLKSLQSDWFPAQTTQLFLDGNPLEVLANGTLRNLTELRVLSAIGCSLFRLESESLMGANSLEKLDLSENFLDILVNEAPLGVFSHVPKLQWLRLHGCPCWRNTSTPNLLVDLKNLESLEFESCEELRVGRAFAVLQNLKQLKISCGCVNRVLNSSLNGLKTIKLQELVLFHGHYFFDQFESGVFQYVPNVRKLQLNDIRAGNRRVLQSLWPFQNKSLDFLVLEGVHLHHWVDTRSYLKDLYISSDDTRFLSEIRVTEFHWVQCRLLAIEPRFFTDSTLFTRNLKKIVIGGNNLRAASEWLIMFIRILSYSHIEEITYGDSRYQTADADAYFNRTAEIVRNVESHGLYSCSSNGRDDRKNAHPAPRRIVTEIEKQDHHARMAMDFPFPIWFSTGCLRAFQLFDVRWSINMRIHKLLILAYMLREVSLVNVDIIRLNYPMGGFHGVRFLDISQSNIGWVNNVLFETFSGISVLLMNNFKNAEQIREEWGSKRLTANLSRLAYLEAESNDLEHLPHDTFVTNVQLRYVSFRGNRFQGLPFDVDSSPLLAGLDLRENSILSLGEGERQQLDQQAQRVGRFSLLIEGNTLVCGCDELSFLGWLKTTMVSLDSQDYPCISQSGRLTSTGQLDVLAVWRRCVGQVTFWLTMVLLCVMALAFLLTYMWGKLKMAVQSYVFSVFVPNFRLKTPEDYTSDVFIGYADEDYRFVRHTLLKCIEENIGLDRTYVHQRDLLCGYLDEQLLQAMRDSWRILLVISHNFLYNYEKAQMVIKMASGSASAENPRRVVALVHESLETRLPPDLVPVLAEDNVLLVQDWGLPLTHAQKLRLKTSLTG